MSETIDKLNEVNKLRSQNIREKLAQTYFNLSPQPEKIATPQPEPLLPTKKSKKQLYSRRNLFPFIFLIIISIFMFLILMRYGAREQVVNPVLPRETKTISLPLSGTSSLLVDDFDRASTANKLGGYFGTFSQTPDEFNQFCNLSFDKDNKIGFSGYSLRLDYSLESPQAINNGFWMSLSNLDAIKYSGLEFFVKGDEEKGYPPLLKLQLKNANQTGTYIINNITGTWQKIYVPFQNFEGIKDLDHLLKLLIIFEAKPDMPKTGTVYIDNLQFIRQ